MDLVRQNEHKVINIICLLLCGDKNYNEKPNSFILMTMFIYPYHLSLSHSNLNTKIVKKYNK